MITCVGIGPGDPGYLTHHARSLIEKAEVVCGFSSVLNFIASNIRDGAEVVTLTYANQTVELEKVAGLHRQGLDCVVAFMGDVHFSGFQLLERVERACGSQVRTVPGISSAQILAARARVCFDETSFITFHRRGDLTPFQAHLLHILQDNRNAIVIPRPWDFMPDRVAAYLAAGGIDPDLEVEVWENLTGLEATWSGRLADCSRPFSDMSIMLIRARTPMESQL